MGGVEKLRTLGKLHVQEIAGARATNPSSILFHGMAPPGTWKTLHEAVNPEGMRCSMPSYPF